MRGLLVFVMQISLVLPGIFLILASSIFIVRDFKDNLRVKESEKVSFDSSPWFLAFGVVMIVVAANLSDVIEAFLSVASLFLLLALFALAVKGSFLLRSDFAPTNRRIRFDRIGLHGVMVVVSIIGIHQISGIPLTLTR